MISLAKFSVRRPQAALAIWFVIALVLSVVGLGVDKSLSPSITVAHTGASQSIAALKGLSSLTSSTSAAVSGAKGQAQTAVSDMNAAISALQAMNAGRSDPNYGSAGARPAHGRGGTARGGAGAAL